MDMSRIKEKLLQKRSLLADEIRQEISRGAGEYALELADAVRDLEEKGIAEYFTTWQFALAERQVQELLQVQEALEKMEAGEYGRCVDCGQEIEKERLEIYPEALRCFVCEDKFEHTHFTRTPSL